MKRFIYLILCILTCLALMTACGDGGKKSSDDTPVSSQSKQTDTSDEDVSDNTKDSESDGKADEVPVNDLEVSEETDSDIDDTDTDNDLTDAQDNVAKNPGQEFQASGTFNGFIDSSSVEITMADGSYQTFFVYEEDVYNHLMTLSESETPPTIQFVYTSREGQINPEIIKVNE